MGKTCKFVYLDRDGEVSSVYLEALEKYGPEKAEDIYIRHMMSEGAKLSQDYILPITPMEDIQKRKSNMISPNGESDDLAANMYRLKNESASLMRANTWLHALSDETDNTIGAQMFGTGNVFDAEAIATKLGTDYYISRLKDSGTMLEYDKRRMVQENPEDVAKHIREIKNIWDAKADWGTYIHEVMEDGINEYNRLMEVDPNANINTYQIFADLQQKYYKQDKKWRRTLGPQQFDKVMKEVLALKANLEKETGKTFKMYPELSMYSKDMVPKPIKLPDGRMITPSGIAGTADLVFVATDGSGEVHIADFKTKDSKSANQFNRSTKDFIGGPFSELQNDAEHRAEAQMAIYGAMLREHGYKPRSANVILIEGSLNPPNESSEQVGNREFSFNSFKHVDTRRLSMLDKKVMEHFKLGEDNTLLEDRRAAGASGTISKWSMDPTIPEHENKGQVHFVKDNVEQYVEQQMRNRLTDDQGRKYYRNMFNKKKVVDNMTDAQIKSQLKAEYAEYMKVKKALPHDVRTYFYNIGKEGTKIPSNLVNKTDSINSMLKGMTPDTHDLFIAEHEFAELSDIGPDVLIARDKRTKALSFFSVNASVNNRVTFEQNDDGSGDTRRSIYGKYVTDKLIAASDLDVSMLNNAHAHDYLQMKLAWAVMRVQKHSAVPIVVDRMKVGSILGKEMAHTSTTDMSIEVQKLKTMRKYAGDEFPTELSNLLDNNKISSPAQYTGSTIKQLISRIEDGSGILTGYSVDNITSQITENLAKKERGEFVDRDIIKNLSDYRKRLYNTLRGKGMFDADIKRNSDFMLVNNALLEFVDFDLNNKQIMQDRVSHAFIRSSSTTSDYFMQKMQVLYNESMSRIKHEFQDFHREHDKALKALFKAKGIGVMGKGFSGSTDEAFTNMYVNPKFDSNTEEQRNNMMKLKDENDSSLTPEEKEYIRIFKKWSKHGMLKCANKPQGIENGDNWSESYVPIMRRKPDLLKYENFKSSKKLTETARAIYEQTAKAQTAKNKLYDFEFKGAFENQADDAGVQHSQERRDMLGLGDAAKAIPDGQIETNLAAILSSVVVAGSEKENMGVLTTIYSAVDTFLADAALSDENLDTKDVREMLAKWKEMIIFDRVKDEGDAGKITDNINKAASKMLFSYSTKQAMTELFTGMVQSTSTLISQQVRKFIMRDKEGSRFDVADWAWAGKAWVKSDPKMEQIVWDHSMLVADVNQLKSEEFKGASKFSLFKSKAAFAMNQHFFNASMTQTFLAEMKKKGIVDAYVQETINGDKVWVYDETKDKRFYIWDGKTDSTKPKTEEEWKKYKLWQAVREALAKEGAITTEATVQHEGMSVQGRMQLPLTSRERTEIKHYATRLYGSFNKNAQVMGQYSATGRAMLRYKNWFAQKYANYNTKTHTSEFYGKMEWVDDADVEGGGYYRWVGKDFEGIIQTVWNLTNEIRRTGLMNTANVLRGMSDIQKENLSKMLADLILLAIASTLIFPFLDSEDNEFMKTDVGKSIRKAISNGTADLNIIGTSAGMTDSLFPGISTVTNSFSNVFTGTMSLLSGDPEAARRQYHGAAKTWGLYRSVTDIMSATQDNK